jgi:hypothetical protein
MRFDGAKIILLVTILSTGINTSSASGVGITPSMQSIEKSSCLTSQSLSEMYSLIDLIEKNYPNDLEETKPIKNKLNSAIQECEVSKDKKLDIDRLKELIVEATNLVLKLQKDNNGTFPAKAAAKKFKNCTELNKVYPGGVAKPGAVNKGGAIKKEPFIDAALYKANIKSDRDKDGIACEK